MIRSICRFKPRLELMSFTGLIVMLVLSACGDATLTPTNIAITPANPTVPTPTTVISTAIPTLASPTANATATPTVASPTATPVPPPTTTSATATTTPQNTIPTVATSSDPQSYFNTIFELIQQNSIKRDKIDWAALRQKAQALIKDPKTTADTYQAIGLVISELDDNHHSSFLPPAQVQQRAPSPTYSRLSPIVQKLKDNLGYIQIPTFNGIGVSAQQYQQFAVDMQELIRKTDETPTCGWLVDLRFNEGGALWPMLAGIGPILGEGEAGAFVSAQGNQKWSYHSGQAILDQQALVSVTQPYHLKKSDPAVAVLTSEKTASSGEALVISFSGRPASRSFGQVTYGNPTGNSTVQFSDGAILNLTTVAEADRTGKVFDGKIQPDQFIERDSSLIGTEKDPITVAARQWLLSQNSCKQ